MTASLRTAPQPGFWEDPKRMRPLDTQRPERPKSELWHKKYEKCGLSKAGDAAWVCTNDRRCPCDGRKKGAIRLDLRRFGIADISLRLSFRMRVLDRFAVRSGRRSIDRTVPRRGRGAKSAEIPRVVWCYDRLQVSMPIRGKAHEHDNVRLTRCVGRRAEADHSTAGFVLFA